MTVTENKEYTCSVCGEKSVHEIITQPEKPSGAPDLDLRPSGAPRNYMKYWAMECPKCGYCATTLDMEFYGEREYLSGDEYKSCGGICTANPDAAKLIKRALVFAENHSYKDAVRSYLAAAWVLDDEDSDKAARECRRAAVSLMDGHPAAFKGDNNFKLLKADLMRRAGDFKRVMEEYQETAYPSLLMTSIVLYEFHLSANFDSRAHKVDEMPGISAAR